AWLSNRVPSFRQLWQSAGRSADAQKRFEEEVGGASWPAFKKWITGAARTALEWFPLALGGMLAGSLISALPKFFVATASASSSPSMVTTLAPAQAQVIMKT